MGALRLEGEHRGAHLGREAREVLDGAERLGGRRTMARVLRDHRGEHQGSDHGHAGQQEEAHPDA